MPYNNTPIAPSKEVSGQVSLPLARVQKIINADPERLHTSKNAAFAIALATELFIQHLATTTQNVVKAETQKKPRRNVQYRDVASAVAKTDNLEFLVDVVPRTALYGVVKKRREEGASAAGNGNESRKRGEAKKSFNLGGADGGLEEGSALDRLMGNGVKSKDKAKEAEENGDGGDGGVALPADDAMELDREDDQGEETEDMVEDTDVEEDAAARQIEMEMRGPRANGSSGSTRRASGFTAINGSS